MRFLDVSDLVAATLSCPNLWSKGSIDFWLCIDLHLELFLFVVLFVSLLLLDSSAASRSGNFRALLAGVIHHVLVVHLVETVLLLKTGRSSCDHWFFQAHFASNRAWRRLRDLIFRRRG